MVNTETVRLSSKLEKNKRILIRRGKNVSNKITPTLTSEVIRRFRRRVYGTNPENRRVLTNFVVCSDSETMKQKKKKREKTDWPYALRSYFAFERAITIEQNQENINIVREQYTRRDHNAKIPTHSAVVYFYSGCQTSIIHLRCRDMNFYFCFQTPKTERRFFFFFLPRK